jgi:hypothetical protein
MSNGNRGDGSSGARVVHVQRIFQDRDPQSHTWVDVERIDELHLIVAGTQRMHYVFNWDVLESEGYAGPKKTIIDPNDKNSKIDIPIREVVHVVGPKGKVAHQFLNDANNLSRETHSRRIYHHAIKPSYLSDGKPPRNPRDYLNSLGNQDKDQFVDVEILDAYITTGFDKDDVHGHSQILADGVPKDSKARTQRKVWQGITDDPFMNEPLLESDEKGGVPGFIFLRNPAAGPTIDPPWRLDPLQNIVNVQWAVADIFVVKGDNSDIWVSSDKKIKNWDWTGTPQDTFAGNYSNAPISYAEIGEEGNKQGIFVMPNKKQNENSDEGGIILYSENGRDWSIGFELYEVNAGEHRDPWIIQPTGIVWDENEKAFYASFYLVIADEDEIGGLIEKAGEAVYRSTDGKSWSQTYYSATNDIELFTDDSSSVIDAHFTKEANRSTGSGPVCDGLQGYNEDSNTLIYPSSLMGWGPRKGAIIETPAASVTIESKDADGNKTTKTVGVSMPCYAVGYFGGIWVACGGTGESTAEGRVVTAKIDVSIDDGNTWQNAYTDQSSGNNVKSVPVGVIGGRKTKT